MIVIIQARPTPMVAALKAAHRAAFLAGAALVAWASYVAVESAYTQWAGSRELARERRELQETAAPPTGARLAASGVRAPGPARGAVLGSFAMPRLGLSLVLLEGTDARTLDRSIGRVADTARVGEAGNIGIAGHRNTHFRKLEWVRRGDEIVLTSRNVEYRYRVEWVQLYGPGDLQVLDPSHGPAVTLITCFPFEYVGSAPRRFIVRALPDDATRARLMAAPPPAPAKL
jgi:sortase A